MMKFHASQSHRDWVTALFRNHELQASLVLLLACAITFFNLANGLPGDFILDDYARIKHANVDSTSISGILGAVLETDSGMFGRVLPLMSLYLTKVLYGEQTEIYKLHNILFHLISALVVFWFIGRLLTAGRFRQIFTDRTAWLFAAFVSSLWVLHPIQVSTALYIVQRMTQFSLVFTLLSLICYLSARQQLIKHSPYAILPLSGLVVFMVAGLLSKESAALIPFYILLIEYFAFRFESTESRGIRIHYVLVTVFGILPIVAGAFYFATHVDTLLHDYVMRPFNLSERIATESIVVWRYTGMLLVPRLSEFTLYHDGIPIYSLTSIKFLVAAAFWIILIALLVKFRNSMPVIVFGIAFFLVSHLLESTVIPLELMFEHRNYIGSLGIFTALVGVIFHIYNRLTRLRVLCIAIPVVLAIGFSLMQMARAEAWSTPYTHAVISAKEHPESARAVSTLANYQAQRGHLEEAKGLIQTAIDNQKHDGSLPGLYLHLVMFNCYEDNIHDELLSRTREAIANNPINSYVLTGLKVLRARMLNGDCPAISRPVLLLLEAAAAANEETRLAYRFFFNGMAGITSAELRHFSAARTYLDTALEYSSHISLVTLRDTYIALAQVCIEKEDRSCADSAINDAKRIDGKLAPLIGTHEVLPGLIESYKERFSE